MPHDRMILCYFRIKKHPHHNYGMGKDLRRDAARLLLLYHNQF